jgi:hypothetical protein
MRENKNESLNMTSRTRIAVVAVAMAIPVFAQTTPKAPAKPRNQAIPRLAGGHPDLQGIWTNVTLTPLERPAEWTGKPTLTEAEAKAFEKHDAETNTIDGKTDGKLLQSKVPRIANAGRARYTAALRNFNSVDNVKNRPLSERCPIGFGSTSGPPMLPVLYNNSYRIVQTPDARIVRIDGTHPPNSVRQWLGDSIGHWEGDQLRARRHFRRSAQDGS